MILIRVDGNHLIGSGHIMRCLSVAKEFAENGEQVEFITADHSGDTLITQNGFETICLESAWNNLESEKKALHKVLEKKKHSLLLIDSYSVTRDYFNTLPTDTRTAYIDDLNMECWDVDFLINYNIFSTSYDYSWYKGTKTKLLLGLKYTPLRDEFRGAQRKVINPDVADVLVSAGGSDPENITEKVISEICPHYPAIRFHFLIGALNPRIMQISDLAQKKANAVLHINETHVSSLMSACDIAIAASGSTLYELCSCGTPTITFSLANNQMFAAQKFGELGLMINAGDCRENKDFISMISMSLGELVNDFEMRKHFSYVMQNLVDGNGAKEIVKSLMQPAEN